VLPLLALEATVTLTGRKTLESVEVELSLERRKLGLTEPPVYVEKCFKKSTRDVKKETGE
jgi:hypothetical protein